MYHVIIEDKVIPFDFRKTKDGLGTLWNVEFPNFVFSARSLSEIKNKASERMEYLSEFAWSK